MSKPEETPERGIPIGRLVVILGVLLFFGLIFLVGTRNLFSGLVLSTPPVVGEWQANQAPWRLAFNEDKTLASSTGPSRAEESQSWTSVPGTYSIDFFGTLWVTLNNGKMYTAALKVDMPNRFDLIDSETFAVTVFERAQPISPSPAKGPE